MILVMVMVKKCASQADGVLSGRFKNRLQMANNLAEERRVAAKIINTSLQIKQMDESAHQKWLSDSLLATTIL